MEPNSAQRSPIIEAFNPPDAVEELTEIITPIMAAKSPIVLPMDNLSFFSKKWFMSANQIGIV